MKSHEVSAETIDERFVPQSRLDVASVELDGELVVAAPGPGAHFDAHWLDHTATIVWETFDGVSTLGQLVDDMAAAFRADRTSVRDDVIGLARTLGRAGLLEGVAYEPPPSPRPARPVGLPVGTPVPAFAAHDLDGVRVTSADLGGSRYCVVNWSPTCGFCSNIATELAGLVPALDARGVALVLVATGDAAENRRLLDAHGLRCRVLLADDQIELFDGLGTPCAYMVAAGGRIEDDLAYGAGEVPELLKRVASVRE
jgi:peroxiredoxin